MQLEINNLRTPLTNVTHLVLETDQRGLTDLLAELLQGLKDRSPECEFALLLSGDSEICVLGPNIAAIHVAQQDLEAVLEDAHYRELSWSEGVRLGEPYCRVETNLFPDLPVLYVQLERDARSGWGLVPSFESFASIDEGAVEVFRLLAFCRNQDEYDEFGIDELLAYQNEIVVAVESGELSQADFAVDTGNPQEAEIYHGVRRDWQKETQAKERTKKIFEIGRVVLTVAVIVVGLYFAYTSITGIARELFVR